MAEKFLEQLAEYITSKLEPSDGLKGYSDKIIVLPTKKSAIFLKTHLRNKLRAKSSRPIFMPRFITLERFALMAADKETIEPYEALFLLFDCYRNLFPENEKEQLSFEKFIFWADVILRDFDDIDSSLVNADEIYKNIKDIKGTVADYLDENQKKVIREYFGANYLTEIEGEGLFLDLAREGRHTRYSNLWSKLGQLYKSYHEALAKKGLTSPGGIWRMAAEKIKANESPWIENHQFLFIGLGDISYGQWKIFEHLRQRNKALFFFDIPDLLVKSTDTRIRAISEKFKMPEDFPGYRPSSKSKSSDTPTSSLNRPEIEVISVGSRSAQAKLIPGILEEFCSKHGRIVNNPLGKNYTFKGDIPDTAIILPDDMMLPYVLNSLPGEDKEPAINISVSMPFRLTPFASLLGGVISLQLHSRKIREEWHFYGPDITTLLSQPLIAEFAGGEDRISNFLEEANRFNISAEEIKLAFPELEFLFNPVCSLNDGNNTASYLINLINKLKDRLSDKLKPTEESSEEPSKEIKFEIDSLDKILEKTILISRLIENYKFNPGQKPIMRMFEKLLNFRMLDTTGKPLQGLQIMGMPESRVLDFDYLVILSANEKILPGKNHRISLIPDNLRGAYGLKTDSLALMEETYNFYRLISRAKRTVMVYDSRMGSFGAGERSRFIEQLTRLNLADMTFKSVSLPVAKVRERNFSVGPEPWVTRKLEEFKPGTAGKQRFLSASALKKYIDCPLQFFMRYIADIKVKDEPTDYIDAKDLGDLFHKALQVLFSPYVGKVINSTVLRTMNDKDKIKEILVKLIENPKLDKKDLNDPEKFGSLRLSGAELKSEHKLLVEKYCEAIGDLLEEEENNLPSPVREFTYLGAEQEFKGEVRIGNLEPVNFTIIIDRMDRLPDGSLRFIDYKTGRDNSSSTIESLFEANNKSKAVFQLLFYCTIYKELEKYDGDILPVVYLFRNGKDNVISPVAIKSDSKKKEGLPFENSLEKDFREKLEELLHKIFVDVDFHQAAKEDCCKYCDYRENCNIKITGY